MTTKRFLDVSFKEVDGLNSKQILLQNNTPMPFSITPIIWVPVVHAEYLTVGSDVKSVIDLSLDISDTDIKPIPGDTIGILPKNPSKIVQELFKRLSVEEDADKICHISVLKTTPKKNASVPGFIPKESTLRNIFESCLDIHSVPKKLLIKSLLEYTEDPTDQSFLQNLSSRDGDTYSKWILSGHATIMDIFQQCPSCHPPISLLLERLPRLLPRPYSISYMSGKDKHMHIIFSVLKYDDNNQKSVGLCTGWLEELTMPLLSKDDDIVIDIKKMSLNDKRPCGIKIPIFWRRSNGFTLPEDPMRPLIMVGPGTGVAPFIGFLQQRQKLIDKLARNSVGESWLFFGCRYPHQDEIFRNEILQFQNQGALSKYLISYSRVSGGPKYVQDNIKLYGKDVCEILLEKNGVFYLCGDSVTMGKDVKECIRNEIAKEKGIAKEEATELLKSLILGGQFREDLWS